MTMMSFSLALRLDDEEAGFDDRRDLDRLAVDGQAAGLDLGDVENAVDQGQQVVGRLLDIAGILVDSLRIGDLQRAQHVGKADDGVERRPQLMAHIGDEFGLGLGGELGLHLGGVESDRLLLARDGMPKWSEYSAISEPSLNHRGPKVRMRRCL